MGRKGGDRGRSIRSERVRGIREETTIRISRARPFTRVPKVARAERGLARWLGIRAVEMVVVADTDHLCVSYL